MENEMARMLWAQTWQVSLLILAVAAVSRFGGRNHPHFAYALWVVVFLKAVTPPIWSSPAGVFSLLQAPPVLEEVAENAEDGKPAEAPPPIPADSDFSSNFLSEFPPLEPEPQAEPFFIAGELERTPTVFVPETEPAVATEIIPAETVPAIAATESTPAPPQRSVWWIVGLGIWLAGTCGSFLLAWGRWVSCRREIRRAEKVDDPLAQQLLQELRTRLRVSRNVILIISRSRIGPAVLGVFRPIVLIPARMMAGKTAADLEPILAHELIHVRRGDLWVGWLQVLAQAVWWFHPLVWWAGRLLKREAERCCDKEVIAELGCPPARYARALLDVLELKQSFETRPRSAGREAGGDYLETIGENYAAETRMSQTDPVVVQADYAADRRPHAAGSRLRGFRQKQIQTASPPRRAQPNAKKSDSRKQTYKVGDLLLKVQSDFGRRKSPSPAQSWPRI